MLLSRQSAVASNGGAGVGSIAGSTTGYGVYAGAGAVVDIRAEDEGFFHASFSIATFPITHLHAQASFCSARNSSGYKLRGTFTVIYFAQGSFLFRENFEVHLPTGYFPSFLSPSYKTLQRQLERFRSILKKILNSNTNLNNRFRICQTPRKANNTKNSIIKSVLLLIDLYPFE